MSAPIKFRVWSEDQKTYDYKFPYNSIGDFYVNTRGKVFSDFGNTVVPEVRQEAFIVEQSTLLKDKNGKEIYEGDICRLIYSERGDGRKRWKKVNEDIELVEFEDGYFKFSDTDQYGISSELSFSDYGEWSTAGGQYKYEAEVIGNIHENKELLGDEDE